MALNFQELLEATARLKAREEMQSRPIERMSIADFNKMASGVGGIGGLSGRAVEDQSVKVAEAQQEIADAVTNTDGDGIAAESKKQTEALKENVEIGRQILKVTKDNAGSLADLASSTAFALSPMQKMFDTFNKIKTNFAPRNLKQTVLTSASNAFKGVPLLGSYLSHLRDKEKWVKAQMKVDPSATREQLSAEWKPYVKSSRDLQKANTEYEDTRKMLGMSDSQFAKTSVGKSLKAKKIAAGQEFAKYERRADFLKEDKEEDKDPSVNATKKNADATATAEQRQEVEKSVDEQTELLKKIEVNTGPDGGKEPTKVESGGLKNIASSFKGGIGGAANGIIGLMLKGAAAIAALGGALLVASIGFKAFADIDWEVLGKAGVAIAGLATVAGIIGNLAAPIALGSVVIAGMGAAVWVLGEALQAVGEGIGSFIDNIERLGGIDGSNLLQVGAGLAAVAAGMVAFGAANAVAGVTNLVSGFLGAITPGKTPVEQLLEISAAGPNIAAAGTGIQAFAEGLTKFSAVDQDKLKLIAELPDDKIITLGKAIAASAPAANKVYGASAENAGAAMVGGAGNGTTNNVVAPTTINNTTHQSGFKPDVRNQDSSFKRMLDSRYVPV